MNSGKLQVVRNHDFYTSDIGGPNDGVTDDLSFETGIRRQFIIAGVVPDIQQQYSNSSPPLWTGISGCSPTSAANIMKYWSSYGYPQLTSGLTIDQLLYQLRTLMGTDSSGFTPNPNLIAGEHLFHTAGDGNQARERQKNVHRSLRKRTD